MFCEQISLDVLGYKPQHTDHKTMEVNGCYKLKVVISQTEKLVHIHVNTYKYADTRAEYYPLGCCM